MDQSRFIAAIETDRRRWERQLVPTMTGFSLRAAKAAAEAVRLGNEPVRELRRAWAGVTLSMARAMTGAYQDGFDRYSKLIKSTAPSAGYVASLAYFKNQAIRMADRMLVTMRERLRVEGAAPITRSLRILDSFKSGGYTPANPSALERAAEYAIVYAYNAGAEAAMRHAGDYGLKHVSVLDSRTTEICEERNGLTLPKNDPYWEKNYPPLHFGCRSVVIPVSRKGPWSRRRPVHPPAPGFGDKPAAPLNRGYNSITKKLG